MRNMRIQEAKWSFEDHKDMVSYSLAWHQPNSTLEEKQAMHGWLFHNPSNWEFELSLGYIVNTGYPKSQDKNLSQKWNSKAK